MIWISIAVLFTIHIFLAQYLLVAKKASRLILWPEYFDKSLPKSRGRRIPLKLATQSPTVDEIAKAAKKLKLNPKTESNKSYPSHWWRKSGRVLVLTQEPKTKVIRRVALAVKKYKK
jgi:signal recognition particle subunit SRP19